MKETRRSAAKRCGSIRRTGWFAAAVFAFVCAVATGGVQLVDGQGVPYMWDLDSAQPNVINGKVTFYLDPAGTEDIVTGAKQDLEALRDGIASWEIGSSRLRFQEDATRTATGKNGTDRVNWVGFVRSGLGRLTFAATFPTRDGSRLLDMDVLFNDADFDWDTRTPGTLGVGDIQGLVTHEWGHAIGFDHVPLRASTMYFSAGAGSLYFRSQQPDDLAMVGSIYPNDAFRQTTGSISGTVTRPGATDHRSIHVTALSLVDGEPAGSTLSQPDGSYTISGLPRGAYHVIAAPTVPLGGAMNEFWRSGTTEFVPAVHGTSTATPTPLSTVVVTADQTTQLSAFSVTTAAEPFEDDDTSGRATLLSLGEGVGARLESGSDVDWYAFDGVAGQKVSIWISAWHIGSQANPSLQLLGPTLQIVAEQDDVRSDALFGRREEGPDLDARLTAVELTSTGRHFVKVENESFSTSADAYYALLVNTASDAPSAALTAVVAAPARLDADGVSQTTITVTPVKGTGEGVGPGATVTLQHDGAGAAGAVMDEGDGTYTLDVTAPAVADDDRFTFTVTTGDGTAVIPDAVILVYLGDVNGPTSSFSVMPRRIAADAVAQAEVSLIPRDARSESLGAGRSVGFVAPGASVGVANDAGDGSYSASVTSPAAPGAGTLDVSVQVDGTGTGTLGTLLLGFPVADVVDQAALDVAGYRLIAGLPSKAGKQFKGAEKQILKAQKGSAAPEPVLKKVLAQMNAAVGKLVKGFDKSGGTAWDLGTASELAQSVRQQATDAIAAAAIVKEKDAKKKSQAEAALAAGDNFRAVGDLKNASKQYLKAWKKVIKLVG